MRLLRNILIILVLAAGFAVGLAFVSFNAETAPLDLLVPGWQLHLPLGWLLLLVLVLGLLVGLLLGLGLKGMLGLTRRGRHD